MQSSKGTKWARQLKALSSGLSKKTRSISSSEPENVQPDKFQNGNFDYFVAGGNFFNWKTFYQSKKCSMPNKCSQPIHWSFFDDVAEIWSRYTNDKVSKSKLPRQCQIVTSISDAIPNEILQRRLFKGELSICEALLAYCAGDLGLIPAVGKSIVQYSDGFSSPRYKVEG